MRPLGSCALASLLMASSACSFDVTRLYPPNDGDSGVVEMDAAEDALPDVPRDGPPPPTCVSLLDSAQGRTIGGSIIIEGTTVRAESTVDPTAACTTMSNGAPEIFFEYQVQRGGTLTVSTDVPNMGMGCPRFVDTVLSVQRGSCEAPGAVIACNDDATSEPTLCTTSASRATATGLAALDRVMVVVDGYQAGSGPFTLTLTENALREVLPMGAAAPTQCGCPDAVAMSTGEDVPISLATDVGAGALRELNAPNQTIGGPRTITGAKIVGIAATLGLTANEFRDRTECNMYSATLDLVIGTTVVRSFVIDRNTTTTPSPKLMFHSAPNITFAPATPVLIRFRSTTAIPMANPCGVSFGNTSGAGNITLLTTR